MSTVSTIHTLVPGNGVPLGYFDEDNIRFIQDKITEVLKREFKQSILIDRASIIRLMERAIEDRIEAVPMMNQRVIMYAANDFRIHQLQASKHLKWEAHYAQSQKYYDPTTEVIRYDPELTRNANRLGFKKVGGTMRFYFT